MISFEKKTLANGIRVIVAPMKNIESFYFLILIGVGSRYETKRISGISHFLEHMVSKRTKKWPEVNQAKKEINRVGGVYNAFTDFECTGYFIKAAIKNFDLALEILTDIYLNPLLKQEELEKERGVILEEINIREDNPRAKVELILMNTLYPNHPLGWDIVGNKESIKNIQREDILKYRLENYLSKNTLIVIVGNFEPKEVFKKIEQRFIKAKKGINRKPKRVSFIQREPRLQILKRENLDQLHLAFAFRGYDRFDEKRYPFKLLSIILGESEYLSKLFIEIREKLGMAYYIYSEIGEFFDCGFLKINSGISVENLEKVFNKIINTCKDFKRIKLSLKELRDVKNFIRGRIALKLETPEDIADFLAKQELFYNKILQPEEILAKIEAVNADNIMKIAKEVFSPRKINLALVGPELKTNQKVIQKILTKI